MKSNDEVIGQTQKWITQVVIGCNFCPFAAREMIKNTVRYNIFSGNDISNCLQVFLDECKFLDNNPGTETSFLIYPERFPDFLDYLEFVGLAERLLAAEGYEGTYQVASFHPEYRFEGAPVDDAANYTNRSPYPMLHLLREESIEKALEHYEGDPEEIPDRNVDFAREKGLTYMKMLRESCLK